MYLDTKKIFKFSISSNWRKPDFQFSIIYLGVFRYIQTTSRKCEKHGLCCVHQPWNMAIVAIHMHVLWSYQLCWPPLGLSESHSTDLGASIQPSPCKGLAVVVFHVRLRMAGRWLCTCFSSQISVLSLENDGKHLDIQSQSMSRCQRHKLSSL